LENVVAVDPTIMDEEEEEESDHGHTHEHGHCHDESCGHTHSEGGETETCSTEGCTDSHHEHSHAHGHEHDAHAHEGGAGDETKKEEPTKKKKKKHNLSLVSSVGYTVKGLLDIPLFNQFMSELLATNAANLYRSKGVLAFEGQGDVKFVFQGVHEQVNFGPSEKPWAEGEERVSKLVFIGKNLEPEVFKEKIRACTVDPAAAVVTMHKRKE
jgi:G3E family GTPase